MRKIYNAEVRWHPVYTSWVVQLPIESPLRKGEFDYVNSSSSESLIDVIKHSKEHLECMEQTYGVTFDIFIIKGYETDIYRINNEHDMITMVLKYS